MKIIILLCLLGLGFLWFALPLPLYGVLNVGNAAGMALCLAGGMLVLFRRPVLRFVETFWKGLPGKIVLIGVSLAFAAVLCVTAFLGEKMIRAAKSAPQGTETVVLLGCKVRGSAPGRMLTKRIAAAKDYLSEHPDAVCILSGGQGHDEEISEAQCMYNELTAAGIAPQRLYMEGRSTSTKENIAFSMAIIEEHGFSHDLAIVTDGFHQYRASVIASGYADNLSAIPSKTPLLLLPTYVLREFFGLISLKVTG